MDKEIVSVSIRFERDMYEWLRRQAYETHTPINAIVREAVDEVMKKAAKKAAR